MTNVSISKKQQRVIPCPRTDCLALLDTMNHHSVHLLGIIIVISQNDLLVFSLFPNCHHTEIRYWCGLLGLLSHKQE